MYHSIGVNTQTDTDISIALTTAKHVLLKLVDSQSVGSLVAEFDNDAIFIDGVIQFLIDMSWIEYNHSIELYQMTEIREKVATSKKVIWI